MWLIFNKNPWDFRTFSLRNLCNLTTPRYSTSFESMTKQQIVFFTTEKIFSKLEASAALPSEIACSK